MIWTVKKMSTDYKIISTENINLVSTVDIKILKFYHVNFVLKLYVNLSLLNNIGAEPCGPFKGVATCLLKRRAPRQPQSGLIALWAGAIQPSKVELVCPIEL